MRLNLKSTTALVALFLLSGCSSDYISKDKMAKLLKENPEILIDVIKAHPVLFLETLQSSARLAQEEIGRQREEESKKELQAYYTNPLVVKIDDSRVIFGPSNAPITIVEYSDFECPFCKRGVDTIEELKKRYAGKIRVIHKNLPLDFHPNAMPAAKYFEAIRMQSNKLALDFYHEVFNQQNKLKSGNTFLESAAKKVGADIKKLKLDLKSSSISDRIDSDVREAQSFGINGTPGFIVNGVPVKGAYPPEHFIGIIDEMQAKGLLKL